MWFRHGMSTIPDARVEFGHSYLTKAAEALELLDSGIVLIQNCAKYIRYLSTLQDDRSELLKVSIFVQWTDVSSFQIYLSIATVAHLSSKTVPPADLTATRRLSHRSMLSQSCLTGATSWAVIPKLASSSRLTISTLLSWVHALSTWTSKYHQGQAYQSKARVQNEHRSDVSKSSGYDQKTFIVSSTLSRSDTPLLPRPHWVLNPNRGTCLSAVRIRR